MDDAEPRLDTVVARAVATLKEPLDLGPEVDQAVLARIARERSGDWRARIGWVAGLAAAAAVAIIVLMNRATAPSSMVEFAIHDPSARSISIVGDFNDWDPAMTPLERSRNGRWEVALELPPGRYRYSYLVNGRTWMADPGRPAIPDADFDVPTSLVTVRESP